ncbi:carbohydrate-binding domain-containing protein [uncultured Pseudoflavonifractor sp.]|uniref:carbohydrate-binding domain-containing protein n=1 Tax=uncultured Pseudoflavonifractor sp. TaxID=1221379 RepID=UPI0025DA5053|nr:carbohydrate-binding domain-containing protein [uncultured Pseudoflavonifractor sp.]
MRNKWIPAALALAMLLSCAACTNSEKEEAQSPAPTQSAAAQSGGTEETAVVLSDEAVTVDGQAASTDPASAVYIGADIVYYEDGHDETYGEGTAEEAHSAEEAAAHTVVTITQPGTYRLSGTLSAGQVAVDLGEDAENDPDAVVTLILDGVDITCTVAPAVIFYNVYECGSKDTETASPTVDTSAAGANVILADGSVNTVTGSHVARIYKEGTEKKLHKYDGAFYSKMSMNVSGESDESGTLNIIADNEGLDSELHLTINSGSIFITAQNDGINTNEDGVSVTTINGGRLSINAGLGAEGDGIDSNGYLTINGGEVVTVANGQSGDGGIDSDSGIYLNGGSVLALGSRNDAVETDSSQAYMELSFAGEQAAGSSIVIKDSEGSELVSYTAQRVFSSLTYTDASLADGATYTVYVDGVQQQFTGHSFGMGGGRPQGGQQPPENMGEPPEGMENPPENMGEPPENIGEPPQDGEAPKGERPDRPEGAEGDGQQPPQPTDGGDRQPPDNGMNGGETAEPSTEFTLSADIHSFSGVTGVQSE